MSLASLSLPAGALGFGVVPASSIAPASGWPTCTLSYRTFHLLWTLPICLVLYLINRPLLTRLDRAKLLLLPLIAFVWTTPWDNLIVKNQAWFYRRHCVWFRIGYIPIEEYFFFVIQSVMTTLWCNLMTRWSLPNLYTSTTICLGKDAHAGSIPPRTTKKLSYLVVPIAAVLVGGGAWMSQPSTNGYYLAMIVWWSAVPLGLLLWGTADFLARMGFRHGALPFLVSVAAPSFYLCASDIYALRRGTWHINERTSLNIFPVPDLPIEEMTFFIVTNTILVAASFTFDRCVAICRHDAQSGSTPLSPSYLPLANRSTFTKLWSAFVRSDEVDRGRLSTKGALRESAALQDLSISLSVLKRASKSFSAASLLLPWDLRSDLGSLYAFCRVADDLVDDAELDVDEKVARLELIRRILDVIYADPDQGKPSSYAASSDSTEAIRDGVHELVLATTCRIPPQRREQIRAAACSVIPMAGIVPRRLWDEMVQGYLMDLDFERKDGTARGFDTMSQLVEYSQCVAGCVGEMCSRVIMARCGQPIPLALEVNRQIQLSLGPTEQCDQTGSTSRRKGVGRSDSRLHSLLYEARRMGVSLQLVNIARDLVSDAVDLQRCYLPLELLDKGDEHFVSAMLAGRVGPTRAAGDKLDREPEKATARIECRDLRKYALRLLRLSDGLYTASYPSLAQLPNRPARAGLRAACAVYSAIGEKIKAQSSEDVEQGRRARMSNSDRVAKALAAIYLDR